jgi:hypothetical protein
MDTDETPASADAVTPEVADELRAMHAIARTVRGSTPIDDPKRKVGEEFTEALAVLVEQGVTVYRLAKVLGIGHQAVYARLARRGYRKAAPSHAHTAYRNTTIWDARRANQADQ